jgi:hypothetical protein
LKLDVDPKRGDFGIKERACNSVGTYVQFLEGDSRGGSLSVTAMVVYGRLDVRFLHSVVSDAPALNSNDKPIALYM